MSSSGTLLEGASLAPEAHVVLSLQNLPALAALLALMGCHSKASAHSAAGSGSGGTGSSSASTTAASSSTGVDPCSPFIESVVSVTYGASAGFGQSKMPGIVMGPPKGGGAFEGSLDVVKLGKGGSITVAFGNQTIVDLPGPDFIVFANPFYINGDPTNPYAEVGTVSVSEDGQSWVSFPCTATKYPYGSCAGWHACYANSDTNNIDPRDPAVAGGDVFDLADIGVKQARFIRIDDRNIPPGAFDLDAIAIVKDASGSHATCSAK